MIFVMCILATYGFTTILTTSAGPYGIIYKAKKHMKALECFMCTSVWVGAFFALLTADSVFVFVINLFAFAGGAILLDRAID